MRSRPGNETRVTVDLKVTVDGTLNGKYLIKGGGIGLTAGLTWEKELTVAKGSTVLETSITSLGAIGDTIDNAELTINWTITHLGQDKSYRSDHHAYITGASASLNYETVLWMGCHAAKGLRPPEQGELDPGASGAAQQVMDAIWHWNFALRHATDVAGNPLWYWGPDARDKITTAELLKFKDGQCGAWVSLLTDVAIAQGLAAYTKEVAIIPPRVPGPEGSTFVGKGLEVYPTAIGQGGLVPTTNRFYDHAVVTFTTPALGTRIYDPSYGNKFNSPVDWEDASVLRFVTYWRVPGGGVEPSPRADTKGLLETTWLDPRGLELG